MTSLEAKKTVSHAMELAFGFAPSYSKIILTYYADNDCIAIDFKICDTEYSLTYYSSEYMLTRRNFYGFGHDLILTFFNE